MASANVDWWDEHNGASAASTVDGETDYGDQGIFSNGSSIGGDTEPAVDTPFAPYYGIEMLSKLGSPGDEMVTSTSSNALVRVHAVRRPAAADVLIDNEDPSNSYTVSLSLQRVHAVGLADRLHAGQQRHVDHVRDAELDLLGDRRALLADRGPASRLGRDRCDRSGSAGPAGRL